MSKTEAPQPLVLVDGSSYLYRAFHALPPLTNSSGQATGAIKGVVSMLRRLCQDYPTSTVTVIFDAKGKTFRDKLYGEYKANRPPMPDELREQVDPLNSIVEAMGLPLLIIPGVEADDVIGTLAKQASAIGRSVLISTGDKDMAQLVDQNITLVNTMTDTLLDEAGVLKKFGIPPSLIIDFLALMGDKVDNIPGVQGVGEKTALALLQNLGGIEDIYNSLDKVESLPVRGAKTLVSKLESSRDLAELSYKLATIKTDVELQTDINGLVHGKGDNEKLLECYQQLEFRSWTEELLASNTTDAEVSAAIQSKYSTIFSKAEFELWLARLQASNLFAFDTETTSLNYMKAEVVGVSFSVNSGEAAYVPFAHAYPGAPKQLDRDWALKKLKPLLEDSKRAKVGQNLKYDASVLANHGIVLEGIKYDTMLQSYVLDSTGSRHDMDSLALKYLGHKTTHFEDIAGKGAKQLTFDQIPLEVAGPYAAEDADITMRLHEVFWPKIEKEKKLIRLFNEIEVPLVPILSRIERKGALLDIDLLAEQSRDLETRILELEKEAHEIAGQAFNLGSPKQLGEILFEKLELPVVKKTPKGAPSTAEDVLVELALDYPLPKLLLEHRSLSKLKSTYTDKLPMMVSEISGRVHTSYHQAVTATGRLSSSEPNLQNIPIRTEEGRRIRKAFIAPPGFTLVAADYSQIELRIMAHLSKDAGLLSAFNEDRDVHTATAAEVFEVNQDAVSGEQRRKAKAINFGLIYGMSAFGLAKQLGLGRNQAQEYIDRYFARYPGVKDYMDATREVAHEQGFVETLFGRRLYLSEINARNKMRQQAAERTAINAPMQGTAADIIKKAMLNVDRWLLNENVDASIIMQVHDELVLEVNESILESLIVEVNALMSGAASLDVPLVVDVGFGENWDEAH
ncbi:MAG: DNA polymerase I [Halieaceae bacterium]|nr:DNA polymerase I [Halieaceae bacterium]